MSTRVASSCRLWRMVWVGGALAAGVACGGPPVLTGRVVDGLAGGPLAGLRLIASAAEAPLSCQTFETTTAEDGGFRIEGVCARTPYGIADVRGALWFPESGPRPPEDPPVTLVAYRAPAAGLVERVAGLDGEALRASITTATEEVAGTSVTYPRTLPSEVALIDAGSFLAVDGALLDGFAIAPLVPSAARDWVYVGAAIADDAGTLSVAPATATPDPTKVREVEGGGRKVRFYAHDALPAGRYVLTESSNVRVRLVDFGQASPWVSAKETAAQAEAAPVP